MTVGQRIAQKRKELGLSQEALGDRLGVSRQSIYKWESDSALPEVEKLITLAKLFGVSVGWLLGVEEAAAPETGGELTEAQLKMVEEIADRYIAAQPKPKPRRRWPWVIAATVLLLTGWNLFQRLDRMDQQYNSLQNSVHNVQSSVNSQINGISSRVEEILKAQNNLTAEYGTEIVHTNLEKNQVVFNIYAVPKTYVEGMTVKFSADDGTGGIQNSLGEEGFNQRFSATLACELTDSIALSVSFLYPDGTLQTQLLDTYENLYTDSLPSVSLEDYNLMFTETPGGILTLSELYISARQDDSSAAVTELKVGLFKNRKLLAWGDPCEKPKGFSAGFDDMAFYRLTDVTVPLTGEDQLEVAALVADEYGRQIVITEKPPYVLNAKNQNLTWPDAFDTDTDPTHWQFN